MLVRFPFFWASFIPLPLDSGSNMWPIIAGASDRLVHGASSTTTTTRNNPSSTILLSTPNLKSFRKHSWPPCATTSGNRKRQSLVVQAVQYAASSGGGSAESAAGAAQHQQSLLLPAIKEWAVTCAALAAGEQTVLLRKGGIREPNFKPPALRFLLFPTSFHSEAALLKPEAAATYAKALRIEPKELPAVPVSHVAGVTGAWTTSDPAVLRALGALTIWDDAFLEGRLRWRAGQPLTLLELRVAALGAPLAVPNRDKLWGCFSFVDVAPALGLDGDAQREQAREALKEWDAAVPVLGDAEFRERQAALRGALEGVACEPLQLS